jgi:hypothetical protein
MTSATICRVSIKYVFLILRSYNRRRELIRLCRWAERKRLIRPLRLYRFRLQDEDLRLSSYELRYPQAAWWARLIFQINVHCFGEPGIIRKGIGAYYRGRLATSPATAKGVKHG